MINKNDSNIDGGGGSGQSSMSSASHSRQLFPSVSSSTTEIAKPNLPQYSSFQQNIELIEPITSPKSDDDLIELSDDSSDSSIEYVRTIPKHHKHHRSKSSKKLKKSSKHRRKHHKSSDYVEYIDNGDGSNEPLKNDHDYLNYLPKNSKIIFIEDIPNLKPEDAYRTDRSGDRNNLAFSRLYERYVPRYNHKQTLRLDKLRNEKDLTKKKKKLKRYFQRKKDYRIKRNLENSNFIYANCRFDEVQGSDYIRLSSVDDLYENLSKFNENSSQNPRQIQFESLKDVERHQEQRLQQGPETIRNVQQLLLELTKLFNRTLADNRNDVRTWIDFINFQDLCYYYGMNLDAFDDEDNGGRSDDNGTSNKRQHRLCIEKKMDICRKALEHNRRSADLNLLNLKLLSKYDSHQMNAKQIDNEWKSICFLLPNDHKIWFEWLYTTLRTDSMMNYKFSRTRKIFKQAFYEINVKQLEGKQFLFQFQQQSADNLELTLLNLTEFLAEFYHSNDYDEKSIALYQSLIEFNLFTPAKLAQNYESTTLDDWLLPFEQFWDSNVPRIGEYSAEGWERFYENIAKNKVENIKMKDDRNSKIFGVDHLMNEFEDRIVSDLKSQFANNEPILKLLNWTHIEHLRQRLQWMPISKQWLAENQSINDIEDVERIISFEDDLKPFIFRLRREESKFLLILKFIRYLRAPLITFALDSAYSTSYFENEFPLIPLNDNGNMAEAWTMESKLFRSHRGSNRYENHSESFVFRELRIKENYYQSFTCGIIDHECHSYRNRSHQAFVMNLFENLIQYYEQRNRDYYLKLTLLSLQFQRHLFDENRTTFKMFRKFLKEILRKFTNSIEIGSHFYHYYARFIFDYDYDESLKIYQTLLKQLMAESDSNNDINNPNRLNLYRITASLICKLLNLDSILQQFITDTSSLVSTIELVPKSLLKNDKSINVKRLETLAIQVLLSVVNNDSNLLDKPLNPVQILRTLQMIRMQLIEGKRLELIQLLILLLYLLNCHENLSNNQENYDEFIEKQIQPDVLNDILVGENSEQRSNLERSFYLLYLQLLIRDYCGQRHQVTLKRIRSLLLERVLITFPYDSLFLSMKIRFEQPKFNNLHTINSVNSINSTPRILDQLQTYLIRKYLNNINESYQPLSMDAMYNLFMAKLHSQLLLLDRYVLNDVECSFDCRNGILNRIRSLFERTLNCDNNSENDTFDCFVLNNGRSLSHCPIIWQLFIRFMDIEYEIKQARSANKNVESNQNKSILYRSLQMCPNHKPLYLYCINSWITFTLDCIETKFSHINDDDCVDECKKLINLMNDQQLRMRTTIEEIDIYLEALKN